MNENIPRYNITIHSGVDYKIDLSLVFDDDEELKDYGALIFNEILYDGTGSTVDAPNELFIPYANDWNIDGEILICTGSEDIAVVGWRIEAQLREYAEAEDCIPFDVWVDTTGYHLNMDHSATELIPYSKGVYDVFVENTETGIRSKLIYGDAKIIRGVTR